MKESTGINECIGRSFDVQDAPARRHPLSGTVLNDPTTTDGVLVQKRAFDHVGDGLKASVRMPRCALGLAGSVIDFAHLVHVNEGVELRQVDAGEGSPNGKTLALNTPRGGRDLDDASRTIGGCRVVNLG